VGFKMTEKPCYTPYHPRWYRRRMSTWWWMYRWPHLKFILREVSSVFVAWFVIFLLLLVRAIQQGDASYQHFLAWSAHPLILVLNAVSLVFVVFHAATWFNLAPSAMVMRMRGQRVPARWIIASNYAAWVVVSIVLAWIILRR
jgi:fumarate reductase subunit C